MCTGLMITDWSILSSKDDTEPALSNESPPTARITHRGASSSKAEPDRTEGRGLVLGLVPILVLISFEAYSPELVLA